MAVWRALPLDMWDRVCYNVGMRMVKVRYIALLLALAAGAANAEPPETEAPREWEADGLYAQARTMLEDKTIQNVSAVPEMLEVCDEAGHIPARLLLLDVYEGTRKGIETRPSKAFALACRMAETPAQPQADAAARAARLEGMYRRALYHERGFGCAVSPELAYKWMARAAVEGLPKAQVELARYLMSGKGHRPAPREALAILRRVAYKAPTTPNLFFYLGHMFINGIGMAHPDPDMARTFFEFGARLKDARAMNNLAYMYERGIGVSKDHSKALRLYKQAAALGNKDASANMQRLAFKTDSEQRESASWVQRIGRASVRVVEALPVSPLLQQWLELPFRRMAEES